MGNLSQPESGPYTTSTTLGLLGKVRPEPTTVRPTSNRVAASSRETSREGHCEGGTPLRRIRTGHTQGPRQGQGKGSRKRVERQSRVRARSTMERFRKPLGRHLEPRGRDTSGDRDQKTGHRYGRQRSRVSLQTQDKRRGRLSVVPSTEVHHSARSHPRGVNERVPSTRT